MIPFQIDYLQILALLVCMGFFVNGARMEMRSPVLWGALSLGAWFVVTLLLLGGLAGGLLSQVLLLAGLAGWEELRERRQVRARKLADAASRSNR